MPKNNFLFLFLTALSFMISACESDILFDASDLDREDWVVEQQPGGTVSFENQVMDINDANGATVWFKHRLSGPLKIEYDAVVIDKEGPNDRVSDLNSFWMATDPEHPDDFFANSKERAGKFLKYNRLNLYYVGYGGHNNSKTRFRRYDGNTDRPLLPEHDLNVKKFMIKPNEDIHITLIANDKKIRYLRNGETIFSIEDQAPYAKGYFGIRTWKNHMKIKNLKILRIR